MAAVNSGPFFFSSSSRGDGSRKSFLRPRHNKAARVQSAPMKSRCIFAVEEIETERKAKKKKKENKRARSGRAVVFSRGSRLLPVNLIAITKLGFSQFFFFSQWPDIVPPPMKRRSRPLLVCRVRTHVGRQITPASR